MFSFRAKWKLNHAQDIKIKTGLSKTENCLEACFSFDHTLQTLIQGTVEEEREGLTGVTAEPTVETGETAFAQVASDVISIAEGQAAVSTFLHCPSRVST